MYWYWLIFNINNIPYVTYLNMNLFNLSHVEPENEL